MLRIKLFFSTLNSIISNEYHCELVSSTYFFFLAIFILRTLASVKLAKPEEALRSFTSSFDYETLGFFLPVTFMNTSSRVEWEIPQSDTYDFNS